jgi:chitin synthase
MDDFSWGNTRVVLGESGRKQVRVTGEEGQPFDINSIPHKKWSEYEQELWEQDQANELDGDDQDDTESLYSLGARRGISKNPIAALQAADLKRSNSTNTVGTTWSVGQMYTPGNNFQNPNSDPQFGQYASGAKMSNGPSDNEIYLEIQRILASADLATITKRQIRDELSALFQTDLTHRKEYVANCINEILSNSV